MRIRETKADKGKSLSLQEERFLFGILRRFSKRSKELRDILELQGANGGRSRIRKKLAVIERRIKMLTSMLSTTNKGLVVNIAVSVKRKQPLYNLDINDLIDEGVVGLAKAIKDYDDWGNKFSSYAQWNIRSSMLTLIRKMEKTVETPKEIFAATPEISGIIDKYFLKYNRRPTAAEISKETGIRQKLVKEVLDSMSRKVYPLEENFPHPNSADVFDVVAAMELRRLVARCMAVLDPKEKEIIERNFFFDESLESIGKDYNVKRQRISQIAKPAKEKVRRGAEKLGLQHELSHASQEHFSHFHRL